MLKVKKVSFDYIRRDEEGGVEGITRALDEVELSVQEGDFIAVLGHNGSGKSTLAKHLNAILLPTVRQDSQDQILRPLPLLSR